MSYTMFSKYHPANPIDRYGSLVISEEYLNARKKVLDERGLPPSLENTVTNAIKIEQMLKHISADCSYKIYMEVIWSIESLNWLNSFEKQFNWSNSAPHRFELHTLQNLVKSYKPGYFSYGTLLMYAKQGGWDEAGWQAKQRLHEEEHAWEKLMAPQELTSLLLLQWGSTKDKTKHALLKKELKAKYQHAEVLKLLSDKTKSEKSTSASKFNPISLAELNLIPKGPEIVKGLIPNSGISSIYGPSGSGKSFAIIDLMCHIATKSTWYGHKINACPITYVALEGVGGIAKRFRAWEKYYQTKIPDTLKIVSEHLSLLSPEDTKKLAQKLVEITMGAGLIVIDTLNQSAPEADENVSKDMGRIISNAQLLQKLTNSHVMLVHHSGKDASKGLRGHSSLLAALDLAIQVNRSGNTRSWGVTKSKDGVDGSIHLFRLEQVILGYDDDNEEINSCVAVPDIQSTIQASKPKPRGPQQAIALMVVTRLIKSQDGSEDSKRIELVDAIKEVGNSLQVEDKRRGERARVAINGLIALNLLTQTGETLALA
jgi:RecA/RadA recombinase